MRITTALAQKRSQGQLIGSVTYGWDAVETGDVSAKGVRLRRLVDRPAEQS
jgi:hypothetical protein